VTVTASGSTPVAGEIDDLVGGTGLPQRLANFHAAPTGTTITAEVRTTGPTDVIKVTTAGPAQVAPIVLTAANYGYVIRGTNFTASNSPNVTFHGVNSNDLMKIPTDISDLYAWTKANIVRIPVSECEWMPYFTLAYSPNYRQQIINAVAAATAHGGTAILSLQHSCHDDPKSPAAPNATTMTGPDTHAIAFWSDAATLFANNPSVMFELFNEPKMNATTIEPDGHTGLQTWRDGGVMSAGSWTWTAPGMQELYNAVRATGATNVVLIDGTAWSSNLLPAEAAPIDGTNIAYAYHAYAPAGTDPSACPATLDKVVAPVMDPNGAYREAAIATEFGTTAQDTVVAATGSAYLQSCVSWFAAHHSSWLLWGWYPRALDSYGVLYAYPMTPGNRTQAVLSAF
jgi:hypothetical protein